MAEFLDNECTHYGCQLAASDGGDIKSYIISGAPVMITAGHDDCHIKMYNELFFLLYISASLAKSKSLPAFIDSHQQLLSEHLI